jgi:formylglycine-generating enzyme required for sulfatase activity
MGSPNQVANTSSPRLRLVFGVLLGFGLLCQLGCRPRATSTNVESGSAPDRNSRVGSVNSVLVPLTNMIALKAGSFVRGKHLVTITHDFWLGKYEVTQAEYLAVIGKNPSHFTNGLTHPVEKVTYFEAVVYCMEITKRERDQGRLSSGFEYRLPSEAEWEYACRAGTTNLFSFGESEAGAEQYAWTAENSPNGSQPVGEKRPNPWGFHDIHGNVWEWVRDWYGNYPDADVTNPVGAPEGKFKVFRGGGWNNDIAFARSANRFGMEPARGIHFVGFRIALCPVGF